MRRPLTLGVTALAMIAVEGWARTDELGPLGQVPGPPICRAGPTDAAATPPPLFEGLGRLSYKIATASSEAQAYFDQGLRWAFAFNHHEARRAFVQAQRLDPGCAMCAWGEALVLGPNINQSMKPEDNPAALAALGRAKRLAAQAQPHEQALIAALAQRYGGEGYGGEGGRADLDKAYGEAMAGVVRDFPADVTIRVLAAEALMNTQPWDYWQADRRTPKGRGGDIVALLEAALAAEPDHPGAIHLYIHAVEASDDPGRALPHARRLEGQMPAAGHLVHMPSHIYYRLGLWKDSLAVNRQAVQADERYFAQAGAAPGIYRNGYYPHNIHFLLVSAQMGGHGADAIAAAEKLAATVSEDGVRQVPWAQPIKAAPYFSHAQFSEPELVLTLPDPGAGLPYVRALWHYARGIALAEMHDATAARAEARAIAAAIADPAIAELEGNAVPAGDVLRIARLVVLGRAEQAEGKLDRAQALFGEAVAIEDKLSYTEPPWWYYPVRQSLGATQLLAGDAKAAAATFREALERVPNNGWALWGLLQAQRAQGDATAAAETEKAFRRAWAGDPRMLQLAGL
jgi:tetratricopeptide (TPR) repeat protein